ncbi:allantoate amidohydrolase [Bradyrhizobium viridifuturi]|jgi:allantoate deiminase|nr:MULTISPECIES: allantoate amidohydrolase [Bradyrhizobium]ERF83069.1 MAG: hydantoinase/carbamoylase family amidase [Bradyrhizobium sp. DFCI-1]QRI71464.1 allantoate amidohydrolase [Bradyrhizobium sp. PSBB068]MBR1023612.1 allantoate amidohydrolase [Bradyrhizobium viridifuturi]MBR1040548.1 allantoate amidohydrolase [Bradyrhizobium viridifuturi]MBR1046869.1 allantoate amidohydrolase [Bradyrhizobium viridifuturi]
MSEKNPSSLGDEIVARIDQLAAISETPEHLARIFLTEEHRKAADLILSWMREAGMSAHLDAIGNVCGRYEGERPGLPALMLGSHYDTVRDAGRWDGPLGVITAIACVADLNRRGKRLPFAIEIVGFADEEGVRFASTLLGSRAVAGTFDESVLNTSDRAGISMRDALIAFGLDPDHIGKAARVRRELLGYVELHIEQGPVLEQKALPVGVVSAISGATRLAASLTGFAGHAGTVPMPLRRDALAGAAECIVAIEQFCRSDEAGLVGTVGYINAMPGATNVIPGKVSFTMDIRSQSDMHRKRAVADIVRQIEAIAKRRELALQIDVTHENRSVPCAPWLKAQIAEAVAAEGHTVFELPSGAGHDGMAMVDVADIGMIFVRCRGGISHNPAEHVELADADTGARVLLRFVENFRPHGTVNM